MTQPSDFLEVAPDVASALASGGPVVALESTLITHGLPYPDNVRAARLSSAAVRDAGATPATIALHAGRIRVGLTDDELEILATVGDVPKVTRRNLADVLGDEGWAGTTVAVTMIAAHLAGIRVFATGGIGGVHRDAQDSMDVSADLTELSRTPVAVVCAGPKSILDVGRTLEVLETQGVPVVAWQSDAVAGFHSRTSGLPAPSRVDDAAAAAALIGRQDALGLRQGVLFTVPIPKTAEIPREEMAPVLEQATVEAAAAGIHGPASTPWVLGRLAELTDGRSVAANIELVRHDASIAGSIAVALAAA